MKLYNRVLVTLFLFSVLAPDGYICYLSFFFPLSCLCGFYQLFSFFLPNLHPNLRSPHISKQSCSRSRSPHPWIMFCSWPLCLNTEQYFSFKYSNTVQNLFVFSPSSSSISQKLEFIYLALLPGLVFIGAPSCCLMFPDHAGAGWALVFPVTSSTFLLLCTLSLLSSTSA